MRNPMARTSPHRLPARLLAGAAALAMVLLMSPLAHADGPTVTGSGSTWVQIALEQWRSDAARFGLSINYQGVGSAAGRQFFIIGETDFAASEIPFEPGEVTQLQQEGKHYEYIPDVAGGTAIMYNLENTAGVRVTNLGLSAATIAGIYTGKILYWDDPAIRKDNANRSDLPHNLITPVIRSDGSGTTAKLADYLYYEAPSLIKPFMAQHQLILPVEYWPQLPHSVSQKSSDGVANFVASDSVGANSIGYVEAGYALARRFPVAGLLNADGKWSLPSSTNVATALTHATLNADNTENLQGVYNAPEPSAYPLASYSYLIAQTTGFDPAKGAVLGQWLIYIACAGQQTAAPLGYSPLPENLIQDVFNGVEKIPGAPAPPSSITPSTCANPTVTGKGFGGGGFGNYVTPGGSAVGPGGGGGGTGGGGTNTGGGGGTNTGGGGGTNTGGGGGTNTGGGGGTSLIPGLNGGGSLDASSISTLSSANAQYRFRAGLKAVSAADAQQSLPFWVAPVGVGLLLIVPLTGRFVRRPRRAGAGAHRTRRLRGRTALKRKEAA
jgi:phosphate transport system substrate-binding protein